MKTMRKEYVYGAKRVLVNQYRILTNIYDVMIFETSEKRAREAFELMAPKEIILEVRQVGLKSPLYRYSSNQQLDEK